MVWISYSADCHVITYVCFRHPEVMTAELDYVHRNIQRHLVKEKLKSWEDRIVSGDTPHLLPALMALTYKFVQG